MNCLTLDATISNIRTVTEFVDGLLKECKCPTAAQHQIDIAIDELLCNIASYAYGGKTGKVSVTAGYDSEKKQFELTFKDNGIRYNPLEKADPDISLTPDEGDNGGLGIFLVKNLMDDVIYSFTNGQNHITIIKKFSV